MRFKDEYTGVQLFGFWVQCVLLFKYLLSFGLSEHTSVQQITPDHMPFRDLLAHFRKHANLRHVAGNNGERQHHPTALAATITGKKCVTDSCNNVVVNPRLAYCNGC